MALLIRSFLETAVNPAFRHSLYHEILYRYHVLGEDSLEDPGFPPYYDNEFFKTIRHHLETSPLHIRTMTIMQWYKVLLDDLVLMTPSNDNTPSTLVPVRAEELSPHTDWPVTWGLARTKGLDSELTAFTFKLLHCLLPTQDRVSRLTRNQHPNPGLCQHCQAEIEDLSHAFFSCPTSCVAGLALLGYLQVVIPDLSAEAALSLEFGQGLEQHEQLAAVCLLATGLKYLWSTRVEKKSVILFKMRADIESKISVLRRTRHREAGELMFEMITS